MRYFTTRRLFFLDVGQGLWPSEISIQFHMVSYCSAIKAILFKLQVILLNVEGTEKSESSYWDRHPSYSPCCSYGKSI